MSVTDYIVSHPPPPPNNNKNSEWLEIKEA